MLVLARQVGGADIVEGMDQGIDIVHLLSQRDGSLSPTDGLGRVREHGELRFVAVGHREFGTRRKGFEDLHRLRRIRLGIGT